MVLRIVLYKRIVANLTRSYITRGSNKLRGNLENVRQRLFCSLTKFKYIHKRHRFYQKASVYILQVCYNRLSLDKRIKHDILSIVKKRIGKTLCILALVRCK